MFIRFGQDYFGFFLMIFWHVTFLQTYSDFDIYMGISDKESCTEIQNKWDIETNLKLN